MRISSQMKPISYLKADDAEAPSKTADDREPQVFIQNGKAKAVLRGVAI